MKGRATFLLHKQDADTGGEQEHGARPDADASGQAAHHVPGGDRVGRGRVAVGAGMDKTPGGKGHQRHHDHTGRNGAALAQLIEAEKPNEERFSAAWHTMECQIFPVFSTMPASTMPSAAA